MTTTTKITIEVSDLSKKIRDAIESSPEPDVDLIVGLLETALDGDEVAAATRRGLRLLVQQAERRMRREALRRAEEDAERIAHTNWRETRQSAAQERLAEATLEHQRLTEERFFGIWKETPTGRKFLGECTAEDLRYSRDRQRQRSDDLLRASAADERLARALEEAGCGTVRELGYERASAALVEAAA